MVLKILASRYFWLAALVAAVLLGLKSPWREEDGYGSIASEASFSVASMSAVPDVTPNLTVPAAPGLTTGATPDAAPNLTAGSTPDRAVGIPLDLTAGIASGLSGGTPDARAEAPVLGSRGESPGADLKGEAPAYGEASVSRAEEEGKLSLKSSPLSPEGLLTDTVLMGWLVSLGLIWMVRKLFREPTPIPSRRQAMVESVIEGLNDLLEPIVGKPALGYAFPALLAYFFFILFHNWSGFLPGIDSIGLWEGGRFLPLLRPMNSDLNATLGIALVSMLVWGYCVAKCAGLQGFCEETFGNKAERAGLPFLIYYALTLIFLAVGCIECISILFRPVSLSFRLFGNVFGGETLLHHMYGFGEFLSSGGFGRTSLYGLLAKLSSGLADGVNLFLSWAGYFLPLPFYFLEGLIGLIQAFVFTLLVAVYIGLLCHHEEELPTDGAMGIQS
ncbi:MAG: F0F1 ATP synthase subunit A [Puniceicoccales bacterium]|jgi:F-type H+-transporting ATPase subunit a|nr:F0F1 ATP synthase subunit A [Puniceicoccales bacterium]